LLEGLARQTDGCRLRERADGGGRKRRQFQARTLLFDALGKRRMTLAVVRADRRDTCLHVGLVDARRLGAAELNGAALGQGGLHLGRLWIVQGIAQHSDFATLWTANASQLLSSGSSWSSRSTSTGLCSSEQDC
jgi:hypothetical protein